MISSRNEPVPGWIDNVYGPTGFFVGIALGLIRTLQADINIFANIVPVDMTVNALITAAWDIGTRPRYLNFIFSVLMLKFYPSTRQNDTNPYIAEKTDKNSVAAHAFLGWVFTI